MLSFITFCVLRWFIFSFKLIWWFQFFLIPEKVWWVTSNLFRNLKMMCYQQKRSVGMDNFSLSICLIEGIDINVLYLMLLFDDIQVSGVQVRVHFNSKTYILWISQRWRLVLIFLSSFRQYTVLSVEFTNCTLTEYSGWRINITPQIYWLS